MILRPCNKCLVKTVCQESCPQIKSRIAFFIQLETITLVSSIVAFVLAFMVVLIKVEGQAVLWSGIAGIFLVLYMILGFTLEAIYIRPTISNSQSKFPDLRNTYHGLPPRVPPFPPPPRIPGSPPPPPIPPPPRYIKH